MFTFPCKEMGNHRNNKAVPYMFVGDSIHTEYGCNYFAFAIKHVINSILLSNEIGNFRKICKTLLLHMSRYYS